MEAAHEATSGSGDSLGEALAAFAEVVGTERLLTGADARRRYGVSTIGVDREILAGVQVKSTEEVRAVLRVAQRFGTPVYPVSTGHNWGYGSANPVRSGSVILDLSTMDSILGFDESLGTVTVQPGVTQGALYRYLEQHRLPFMVPTHGGGPDCSLVGNALERGYGITPHADHFLAVRRLRAVLPDGELYESPLSGLGARAVDEAFKWGIGPHLDGIFSQSNFGVVTEMTIALARRPEAVEAYFFIMERDDQLEEAVAAVHAILERYPGVAGSVNLMNRRRTLSMVAPYPRDQVPEGGVMSDRLVEKLTARYGTPAWTGLGCLYGRRAVVKAARREIRRELRRFADRVVFLDRRKSALLQSFVRWLPIRIEQLKTMSEKAETVLDLLEGKPSRVALPLAYWRMKDEPPELEAMDPARDGCGLMWYAPLVPVQPAPVREFVRFVDTVCREHGVEPLITLTAISSTCFDSTIPILFDRQDAVASRRAGECSARLLEEGRRLGFFPYRLGVHQMERVVDPADPFWRLAETLKNAVDPQHILAPGRYSASS